MVAFSAFSRFFSPFYVYCVQVDTVFIAVSNIRRRCQLRRVGRMSKCVIFLRTTSAIGKGRGSRHVYLQQALRAEPAIVHHRQPDDSTRTQASPRHAASSHRTNACINVTRLNRAKHEHCHTRSLSLLRLLTKVNRPDRDPQPNLLQKSWTYALKGTSMTDPLIPFSISPSHQATNSSPPPSSFEIPIHIHIRLTTDHLISVLSCPYGGRCFAARRVASCPDHRLTCTYKRSSTQARGCAAAGTRTTGTRTPCMGEASSCLRDKGRLIEGNFHQRLTGWHLFFVESFCSLTSSLRQLFLLVNAN